MQSAGREDKVSNKNEEAVMFKKYSWLIYVFIIAFLLPGNFFYLLAMKNRKAAMTRLIPEKEDPVNRFTAANDRHIVFFEDSGNLLTLGYVGKVKPKVDFAVFLAKRFSPVWQITWNGDDYFDYNGDMIFDLKMPRDARKNGFMFSDGGVWKPCRAVKITMGEILYNGKPYVFKDGRWQEKPAAKAETK